MKRSVLTFISVMLMSLTAIAFAGEGHKCTADAQACLTKMVEAFKTKGWVGIETEKIDNGFYNISRVVENSPAEKAGIQKGDVLVAINGLKVNSEDEAAWKAMKSEMGPGKEVKYTVERAHHEKVLTATLATPPENVMAQWVGVHMMKDHAEVIAVANN